MSFIELLHEFNKLGCKDQSKTSLACRVYQHLQSTKKYTDIDKTYDKELDLIYVHGYGNESRHIFLPFISTLDLEMKQLQFMQDRLKFLNKQCTIHLAICDTASNVLYYTVTSGFLDNKNNVARKL